MLRRWHLVGGLVVVVLMPLVQCQRQSNRAEDAAKTLEPPKSKEQQTVEAAVEMYLKGTDPTEKVKEAWTGNAVATGQATEKAQARKEPVARHGETSRPCPSILPDEVVAGDVAAARRFFGAPEALITGLQVNQFTPMLESRSPGSLVKYVEQAFDSRYGVAEQVDEDLVRWEVGRCRIAVARTSIGVLVSVYGLLDALPPDVAPLLPPECFPSDVGRGSRGDVLQYFGLSEAEVDAVGFGERRELVIWSHQAPAVYAKAIATLRMHFGESNTHGMMSTHEQWNSIPCHIQATLDMEDRSFELIAWHEPSQ